MLRGHPVMPEGKGHDVTREAFSVARYGIDGARCQLAQDGEAFDQFGELLEMLVERTVELGAAIQRNHQAGFARMIVAQVVKLPDVVAAFPANGGAGDRQELVGGFAHGGNHHYRPPGFAPFDNTGDTLDGGGRLDRGAAELHHHHQSSIPSECISSAFNTAAPAAPRMVLWVSTTNL